MQTRDNDRSHLLELFRLADVELSMAAKFTVRHAALIFRVAMIAVLCVCNTSCSNDRKNKEVLLKADLKEMRKLINQYAADQGALPSALDDLVKKGYLYEIPIDPVTGNRDWEMEIREDQTYQLGHSGMVDVHSKAAGKDSQGKPYSEY